MHFGGPLENNLPSAGPTGMVVVEPFLPALLDFLLPPPAPFLTGPEPLFFLVFTIAAPACQLSGKMATGKQVVIVPIKHNEEKEKTFNSGNTTWPCR